MATKHYVRNQFNNEASFPATGEDNILYEAADTGTLYRWNVVTSLYEPWGAGGSNSLHYIAALDQTGSQAPVATVIRNDFDGELVWSNESFGEHIATLTGIGIGNVRVIPPVDYYSPVSVSANRSGYQAGVNDDDSIYLNTYLINNSTGVATSSQGGILAGAGYSYIEIIKYL